MKNYIRKFAAALLVFTMVISTITPAAFAAPAGDSDDSTASAGKFSLSSTARNNIKAAKIISSLGLGISDEDAESGVEESEEKAAVKEAIFSGNGTTDLSRFNISSKKMDAVTAEILEENNLTDAVDVTYETDSEGNVTTTEVEMDPMVALMSDELEANQTVYGLTDEQSQTLLGMYAQYIQLCEENADMFGVQVPYNTTRDSEASPIGSLLDIAGISEDYAQAGYIGYDVLSGLVQLYYLGTQFAVSEYKDEVIAGRNEALASIEEGMTTVQKYLAINEWLAANCTFAMDYIMEEMVQPVPSENPLYTYAYNCMYNVIYQQVYDGTYNALVDIYGEDQAKTIAEMQAESYMADVQEEGGSGAQQAASTASAITGLWGSNQVGVFVGKKAVCFGYANVYAYLLQCANPGIYLNDVTIGLDEAENWKSYKELNYIQDENGDYVWSADSAAIADYVKIKFDAEITMFGQDSNFSEVHYWNAVKIDGNWYYVDPCYIDIYVECMNRDRVETDGNLNNLYFLFSDTTCRDMYEGNIDVLYTLYEDIATDTSYEHTWFSYAKSHTYKVDDRIYYFYDSTDLINIMNDYGNGSSGTSRAADGNITDYESLFTNTEYKLVYHDATKEDTDDSFVTLVDFNNGQVYNPEADALEDNVLIADLYEEHQAYVEEYPSISISCAYYDGMLYFSLSNCILSYDLETGAVEKLVEYTEVSGKRDMSQGLGGMGFSMASEPGDNGITVQNPPLADMTIKPDEDGNMTMYVSVATRYAFISGKDFGELKDYSSYGYQFAESNYNPVYNAYYNSDEENDNDEFMWCANIVGTIDMEHLTGGSHVNETVTVPASCTEDEYSVTRCQECGKIESEDSTATRIAALNIKVTIGEGDTARTISTTLTESGKAGEKATFSSDDIQAAVEGFGLPAGYNLSGTEYTDIKVPYGASAELPLTATVEDGAAAIAVLNIEVKDSEDEDAQILASTTLIKAEGDTAPVDPTDSIDPALENSAVSEGEVSYTAEVLNAEGDPVFTVTEINNAIAAFGTIDGYSMPEYAGEDVEVAYGGSNSVSLTAKEVLHGTGHRYVEFNETYYTKDDNGDWQTGTSYVCVDCGHAFEVEEAEEDEEQKTVEDYLEGSDTIISDEEVSELKNNLTRVWTWSTDGTEASMYQVPADLKDHRFDCIWENPALSIREVATVEGDCETGIFTATLESDNTKTATKDVGEGKHSYLNQEETDDAGNVTQEAAVKWIWADDYSSATAYFLCDVCGAEHEVTASVADETIKSSTTGATCTESGSFTYTATVTVDDVNYISSRTVENPDDPATGHTYIEDQPTWNWEQEDPEDENSRCTGATATFTCSTCGDVTVEAEITKKLNRKTSTTTYIATAIFDEKEYTDEKTVNQIFEEDSNPFEDVDEDDYYYDAVMWALDNGITTGYDATHFAPKNDCKRADVVTFLWRTMGKPEPTITENPFEDIPEDEYYYKAVLWAYENNITKGYDATHFAPDDTVTRAQFVTFIYRQKGEPSYTTENPFEDVKEGEYYYDAVLWAYENGITTGYDATHFAPDNNCIRGDIVTFLYRTYGKDEE
ncbi:MAG: S-layer homology domain-containing protein [Lentihominibacter sp.]